MVINISNTYSDLTNNFPDSIDPNRLFRDPGSQDDLDKINFYKGRIAAGDLQGANEFLIQFKNQLEPMIINADALQFMYDMNLSVQRWAKSRIDGASYTGKLLINPPVGPAPYNYNRLLSIKIGEPLSAEILRPQPGTIIMLSNEKVICTLSPDNFSAVLTAKFIGAPPYVAYGIARPTPMSAYYELWLRTEPAQGSNTSYYADVTVFNTGKLYGGVESGFIGDSSPVDPMTTATGGISGWVVPTV